MKLTFLGTGTSTGVPQIGCRCKVCTSGDYREKRLRASAMVETDSGERLLLDCGPDFREQILREGSPSLSALLITHSHYDHVGGLDDLRPYCHPSPFPVYCSTDVADDLRQRLPYSFRKHLYPGVPVFDIHVIQPKQDFFIGNMRVTPLPIMHAKLPILGYKIGSLAYITDCSSMPPSTIDTIQGIDTLIINALRHEPHMSHMNLRECLDIIHAVRPRQAFLTHMSHDMGLMADNAHLLPDNVKFAVDRMVVSVK